MEPEDIADFQQAGRGVLTALATSIEVLKKYADAFEVRGGTPVFGSTVLEIVQISNTVQAMLTPEIKATIARLRTDI